MLVRPFASAATLSSSGDSKINDALGLHILKEIKGASTLPQKEGINDASALPPKERVNDASALPQKDGINDASALPQKEGINDASALPQTKKSNDASAILIYQVTSGIAVFSFDGGYLNNEDFYSDGRYRHDSVKDFWACLPRLTLRVSMNYKKVPTPIDLVNEEIDDRLKNRLEQLCGPEKKFVVGSAEYKRIIETKLPVSCLYVDAPDCEVIIRKLKNPIHSVKVNAALAMLLYQAPSGIAIFCFDGGYLQAAVKDFWACLPPLSLIVFIKKEKMCTPICLANEVIDGHLAKKLRQLCHSGRKLVVGSAEYKRIIKTKLEISCLHFDVPDCEVKICRMHKPMPPLPPEKQSEPDKDLELFLYQRGFDVKLEMVDKSVREAAYLLHDNESSQKKYLKFFRLLLKDFFLTSKIDTTTWVPLQFATALKMICYPEASYEVLGPDEVFSFDECSKIEAHASGYRRSFLKIDVLSVYKHAYRLDAERLILMRGLELSVMKAKKVFEEADVRLSNDHFLGNLDRTDFRTGSKVGKEASTNVDDRLNSVAQNNCSDPDDGKRKGEIPATTSGRLMGLITSEVGLTGFAAVCVLLLKWSMTKKPGRKNWGRANQCRLKSAEDPKH